MDEERRAHGGLEHAGNSPRRLLLPAYGQWRNLGKRGLVVVEVIPFRGARLPGHSAIPALPLSCHYILRSSIELVFIFLSCGEDFLRSSFGPGWLELPIFPPRRVNQQ